MPWKRTATALMVVGVLAATTFVASASQSTKAFPGIAPGPSLSPTPTPSAEPGPFISAGPSGVLILADNQALYFNDQDTAAGPACVATCAKVWHPVVPPADGLANIVGGVTGTLSTAPRPDGKVQVTYNGRPLYVFTVDAPGNVTGDNVIDAFAGQAFSWHAATASGQPLTPDPSSPTLTPSSPALPSLSPPSSSPTPSSPTPSTPAPTPSPSPTA
jgi:predicted lipoprotein with Yx(FWY)xxD motif